MDKMQAAADIVRKVNKTNARIATLSAQKDADVAELLALGWDSGKHVTSAGPFTVSAVNSYPQDGFTSRLTGGQQRLCWKPRTLDPAKVKAFYPAVYAAAKVENGQRVTF